MLAHEASLLNALVATPMPSSLIKPLIKDIYTAIQNQYGPTATPTNITAFPPYLILEFPTSTA
uniref:Uncharacterized protein n=1 Tax=Arundo donax TaxID=35708 RepID=A0A0A8ZVK2_ARUDO